MIGNTFDGSLEFCSVVSEDATSVLTILSVRSLFVGIGLTSELVILLFILFAGIAEIFIFGVLLVSNSLVLAAMKSLRTLVVKESRQRRRRHETNGGCRVGLGRSPRNVSVLVEFDVTLSTLVLLLNTVFACIFVMNMPLDEWELRLPRLLLALLLANLLWLRLLLS